MRLLLPFIRYQRIAVLDKFQRVKEFIKYRLKEKYFFLMKMMFIATQKAPNKYYFSLVWFMMKFFISEKKYQRKIRP